MSKIKNIAFSLLVSFVVAIVFLSLSACIFAYTNINDRHLETFVFGVVMFSVLIGSTVLSKKIKEKGLMYGAMFGLIFCLIIYVFTCLSFTGFFVSNTLGVYLAISVLSGIIGGVIGVNI